MLCTQARCACGLRLRLGLTLCLLAFLETEYVFLVAPASFLVWRVQELLIARRDEVFICCLNKLVPRICVVRLFGGPSSSSCAAHVMDDLLGGGGRGRFAGFPRQDLFEAAPLRAAMQGC